MPITFCAKRFVRNVLCESFGQFFFWNYILHLGLGAGQGEGAGLCEQPIAGGGGGRGTVSFSALLAADVPALCFHSCKIRFGTRIRSRLKGGGRGGRIICRCSRMPRLRLLP